MIDRETFDRIKKMHGDHASWAVWAEPTDTTKLNMGELSVLDPDQNPTLLQILRNDVVMLGLNVSKPFPEPAPFRNFHYAGGCQDYKTRYAFADTPCWGAYMTDLIKDVPMLESKALIRYLSENPPLIEQNVERLVAEFSDLGCDRPTVLTFGIYAHQLFVDNFPRDKYSRPIRLRHYSDYISPEKYRLEVLSRIGDDSHAHHRSESYPVVPSRHGLSKPAREGRNGLTMRPRSGEMKIGLHSDPRRLAMDANADKDSDRPQISTLSRKPRTDPYYQKIDALGAHGAHRTHVHQVADVPRVYEGRCFECGWRGSETTGTKALQEMLAHTQSTLPVR